MAYLYEIGLSANNRRVRAKNAERGPKDTNLFQPAEFTSAQLGVKPSGMFGTSRLETLVELFTDYDPAQILDEATQACQHDAGEECDCKPVRITIPASLAFHVQLLWQDITEYDEYNPPGMKDPDQQLTARKQLLDRWYEQGIALYQAWMVTRE